MSDRDVLELLERFVDAWNAHDVDALLNSMTEDGVFYSSAGPAPSGARHVGREALGKAYAALWQTYPDAQWTNAHHFVSGENACSGWTFTGTKADGSRVEVDGCDLFKIRDGKIAMKNSFRKQIQ
jgi:ketosteroid isomerase-like protein